MNTSVWIHAGLSPAEAMHSIARLGIRYVDYFAAKQGDPRGFSREERSSLTRSMESLGLNASNMVMILPGNIASGDRHELARCLEYVKACLELSRDMGGRQVLLAAGERTVGMPSAMAWENARHALNIIADEAASYDQYVTLELEPCVYSLVQDTVSMLQMIRDVNHPRLLANIDIGHLAITREGPEELDKLAGYLIHVHISDNNGMAHANDIIGTGVTLVREYLCRLVDLGIGRNAERIGIPMVAGIELGVIGQSIDDPDRWARESLDWLRAHAPFVEN